MDQQKKGSLRKHFKKAAVVGAVSLMALATFTMGGDKKITQSELDALVSSGNCGHARVIDNNPGSSFVGVELSCKNGSTVSSVLPLKDVYNSNVGALSPLEQKLGAGNIEYITAGNNKASPYYAAVFLPLLLLGGALGFRVKNKLSAERKDLADKEQELKTLLEEFAQKEADFNKEKEQLAERTQELKDKEIELSYEQTNLKLNAVNATLDAHSEAEKSIKEEWERLDEAKKELDAEYKRFDREYDNIENTKYLISQLQADVFEKNMQLDATLQALEKMKKAGGVQGGAQGGAKSAEKTFEPIDPNKNKVRFSDVAGMDDIMQEVSEIVDFIKAKERFEKVNAKQPKGALLAGDPGTGKTLLAKAIAGEAGLPFLSVSGSDFVEKYVGTGAARVRSLFETARKAAKEHGGAVVFIDEIDAVGKQRGGGSGGGSDEREQTLNQILVEMDGFEASENIIVIAATNLKESLDNALTRPGRFDRQVNVKLPDLEARKQIIGVHVKGKPLADDVEIDKIARNTYGKSGAYIANLVNEAAIFAARKHADSISSEDFDQATEKCSMGIAGKMTNNADDIEKTSYHEGGHALLGVLLENHSVYKVNAGTITPRGGALGYINFAPEKDVTGLKKTEHLSWIYVALAGQVAEELINGEHNIGSGASQDLKVATSMLRDMAEKYGMFPEEVGPASLGNAASDAYKQNVETFVNKKLREMKKEVTTILTANIDSLHSLAQAFVDKETLTAQEIKSALGDLKGLPTIFTEQHKGIGSKIRHRTQVPA